MCVYRSELSIAFGVCTVIANKIDERNQKERLHKRDGNQNRKTRSEIIHTGDPHLTDETQAGQAVHGAWMYRL